MTNIFSSMIYFYVFSLIIFLIFPQIFIWKKCKSIEKLQEYCNSVIIHPCILPLGCPVFVICLICFFPLFLSLSLSFYLYVCKYVCVCVCADKSLTTGSRARSGGGVLVVEFVGLPWCINKCGIFPGQRSNQCTLHWQAQFFTTETWGNVWPVLQTTGHFQTLGLF